jgi:hypothetical protein
MRHALQFKYGMSIRWSIMRDMRYDPTPAPSDGEIAAALAAIQYVIERTEASDARRPAARPAWRVAGAIESQGLPPARNGANDAWGTVDRAARANRWSYGIAGL